jgi:hypothetical protein
MESHGPDSERPTRRAEQAAGSESAEIPPEGGAGDLHRITARLRELAAELDAGPGEERAEELVREASELAERVGREVERATRAAATNRGP